MPLRWFFQRSTAHDTSSGRQRSVGRLSARVASQPASEGGETDQNGRPLGSLATRIGCTAQANASTLQRASDAVGNITDATHAPLSQARLPFGRDRRKKVRDGHKYDAMYTVTESGEWFLNPEPGASAPPSRRDSLVKPVSPGVKPVPPGTATPGADANAVANATGSLAAPKQRTGASDTVSAKTAEEMLPRPGIATPPLYG